MKKEKNDNNNRLVLKLQTELGFLFENKRRIIRMKRFFHAMQKNLKRDLTISEDAFEKLERHANLIPLLSSPFNYDSNDGFRLEREIREMLFDSGNEKELIRFDSSKSHKITEYLRNMR